LAPVESHPSQPRNPYDRPEPLRGPPPPPPPPPGPVTRGSPRVEQLRHYEPNRPSSIRRPSPPPMGAHPGPSPYGPQQLPTTLQPSGHPNRILNPNHPPTQPPNGLNSSPAGPHLPMQPPARLHSPPPEIKPIHEHNQTGSPAGLPHMQPRSSLGYSTPTMPPVGPPTTSYPSEVQGSRDHDDRPQTGIKRPADSDDDYKIPNKKHMNGESRSRFDEDSYHRGSPKDRPISPGQGHQRSNSSEVRREQMNRDYHPSDAAHHLTTLPVIPPSQPPPPPPPPPPHSHVHTPQPHHQPHPPPPPPSQLPPSQPEQAQQPTHAPPVAEAPREERPQHYDEAPRRKMEVDEDYDDTPEDEKRVNGPNGRTSPVRPLTNGQPKVEQQA
jgi:general transcriptional corepressor CYC8